MWLYNKLRSFAASSASAHDKSAHWGVCKCVQWTVAHLERIVGMPIQLVQWPCYNRVQLHQVHRLRLCDMAHDGVHQL